MSELLKWPGKLSRLKEAVTFTGHVGEWEEHDNEARFRGNQGEVLTYWPSTGAVSVQGKRAVEFAGDLSRELGLVNNTLLFD
ncbi:hypothetical protein [Devosia sp. 2618]|uniref:hypothetical protein n=1 Tax=Devosia sp. 2618 TaxID=3156454 RepID=UPI003397249C